MEMFGVTAVAGGHEKQFSFVNVLLLFRPFHSFFLARVPAHPMPTFR
jgi:hypothetical protein